MKSYLEHVHITVYDLDSVIEFIQTAMPDFKVRSRFFVHNSFNEWVHLGTDKSYLTLVKPLPPNKVHRVVSHTKTAMGFWNFALYGALYFFKRIIHNNQPR